MKRLFWGCVFGFACIVEMLADWLKDTARDRINGEKKEPSE